MTLLYICEYANMLLIGGSGFSFISGGTQPAGSKSDAFSFIQEEVKASAKR